MQEGLEKKINYSWIEIVPLLAVLLFVVVALAVLPNCLDNSSCTQLTGSPDVDLDKLAEGLNELNTDNLFSVTILEKP